MSENIICKLNVSKVEKDRLFKGTTGTWLECVLIPSKNDKYGNDFLVVQSITKEERLARKRGVIIGNAKFIRPPAPRQQQASGEYDSNPPGRPGGGSDDVPY